MWEYTKNAKLDGISEPSQAEYLYDRLCFQIGAMPDNTKQGSLYKKYMSGTKEEQKYGTENDTENAAQVKRCTRETDITARLNLDGSGICRAESGIGFLDHMLDGFARHGLFDLELTCKGDLQVDCHHTVEDVGIVLGEAIRQALGEKKAIRRYGSMLLPMDEALVLCAIDLSGRPYLSFEETYTVDRIGDLDTEMIHDFFMPFLIRPG